MRSSRPFTLILHIVSNNEYITDLTIHGVAERMVEPDGKVEQLSYTITQIVLDRDDITDIASYLDIQQINNACLNFAQSVFSDDTSRVDGLRNFSLSTNQLLPAIAN